MLAIMDKAVIVWLVIALFCVIIEVVTPMFGFLLVGFAAGLAAALAGAGMSAAVQIVVFGLATIFSLTFLRSRIAAKLAEAPGVPSRTERLIGKTGRVTEAIDPVSGQGRINVDGHDWAAEAAEPIPVGKDVCVEGADGIRLKIRRLS